MSLDYPYYEELCRRKHRAAWWWLVGDRLYYLGLLPAGAALSGLPVALLAGLFGAGWQWTILAAAIFPIAVLICVLGSALKQHAYTRAERDGISAAEVYARSATHSICDDPSSGRVQKKIRHGSAGEWD